MADSITSVSADRAAGAGGGLGLASAGAALRWACAAASVRRTAAPSRAARVSVVMFGGWIGYGGPVPAFGGSRRPDPAGSWMEKRGVLRGPCTGHGRKWSPAGMNGRAPPLLAPPGRRYSVQTPPTRRRSGPVRSPPLREERAGRGEGAH